mmetsp:Transcript_24723/g.82929  ORF Transcript_24723/g.82929 Transcript_24723/m.82929 type:complete len:202 (-) Transcript_24723:130-735(-)
MCRGMHQDVSRLDFIPRRRASTRSAPPPRGSPRERGAHRTANRSGCKTLSAAFPARLGRLLRLHVQDAHLPARVARRGILLALHNRPEALHVAGVHGLHGLGAHEAVVLHLLELVLEEGAVLLLFRHGVLHEPGDEPRHRVHPRCAVHNRLRDGVDAQLEGAVVAPRGGEVDPLHLQLLILPARGRLGRLHLGEEHGEEAA